MAVSLYADHLVASLKKTAAAMTATMGGQSDETDKRANSGHRIRLGSSNEQRVTTVHQALAMTLAAKHVG